MSCRASKYNLGENWGNEMDYFQNRRLRWRIPLKLWLISCLALTMVFSTVAGLSTIIVVKTSGIHREGNPIARMFFENFGPGLGMILIEIIGFIALAIIIFLILYKHFFLTLFMTHSMLIMFFLISLNDYSYVAAENVGKILSFARIFATYPPNIPLFLSLGFISTLLVTTTGNQKKLS